MQVIAAELQLQRQVAPRGSARGARHDRPQDRPHINGDANDDGSWRDIAGYLHCGVCDRLAA
jgi:hypothetical protein